MGWNSWDSYGLSVAESEFRANTTWLARNLKAHGWRYAVVDEGWYLTNPSAKPGSFAFRLSADGRYLPAENRFPSARGDVGFRPLADELHRQGLKFGIHIIRGIPREAVRKDLPIANSSFRAADAADQSDTCSWNTDNYGVRYSPAGQAYYDSLAELYAKWGVDLIKVDCIAQPYKGDQIRMISDALKKTGRPMVLSLSPGPAPLGKADELRKEAQMWRISGDIWDHWAHDPKISYSQSIVEQFPLSSAWSRYAGDGHCPDEDMLPLGYLGPRPGAGSARATRLAKGEQRTLMTLWCMARSPLFMGGNLTKMDEWTKELLTNDEVLAANQHASGAHQVSNDGEKIIWAAKAERGAYVALFNVSDVRQTIRYPLQSLGAGKTAFQIRDLWLHRDLGTMDTLRVDLAPHESVLYGVK